MCGNRVEELESRVKELEASVEGLTDELVECKVRLRELEDAIDEDLGFVPGGQRYHHRVRPATLREHPYAHQRAHPRQLQEFRPEDPHPLL
ncbi:hypothetical protein BRD19_08250 [Halobacteriales archaeon SW_7_65_23]|nr:MAG: hypothetical protein BRD19_08250 [Halobacteriales archaeon SW_7_65_23]